MEVVTVDNSLLLHLLAVAFDFVQHNLLSSKVMPRLRTDKSVVKVRGDDLVDRCMECA